MTYKAKKKTHTKEIEKYFETLNKNERERTKEALEYIRKKQYGSDTHDKIFK